MIITPNTPVGAIVAQHPVAARLFHRSGIDYCCGGKSALAEACAERGLDPEPLIAELQRTIEASTEEASDWQGLTPAALSRYIVERFHVPLREDLARLGELSRKALGAHGERYAGWLPQLDATFHALREELLSHLEKEEQILFPFVVGLEEGGGPAASPFPPAMIGGPIGVMEAEHDDAGRALERMRALTDGYQPPVDACATVQTLFDGLRRFEEELHRHIHLENEVLFPQALILARPPQSAPHGAEAPTTR